MITSRRVSAPWFSASIHLDKILHTCTIVNMNIVADTNTFLAVVLNEPEKENIIRATANTNAISPEILPYEIGNALTAMVKRKKITQKESLSAFNAIRSIPVRLISVDIQEALKLAFDHNIYAYDAYFLQCAKHLACPLITLDRRMQKVAYDLNIEVVE